MQIGTNGLITDQFGKVLVMLRDDTRTWTIPGGVLAPGELPDEGVSRQVEAQTGLKVMPGRLVGLYYRAAELDEHLVFTFRCLVRGGQIVTSGQSSQIGYAGPVDLPRPMLGIHRERIERAVSHSGGRPYWGVQEESGMARVIGRVAALIAYARQEFRRRRNSAPALELPPDWTVSAFVVIREQDGGVLWCRGADRPVWSLPGGEQAPGDEPPWETAVRETGEQTGLQVELTDLTGVYHEPPANQLALIFTAEASGGEPNNGPESGEMAYFAPGEEPADSLPKHVERAAAAVRLWDTVLFRRQEEAADRREVDQTGG
jgi:ADP-ribose pyrophosphatase YjhB (NUDIX family)